MFLSIGACFAVPEAPDFLAAGDFNNDGHLDLLLAARGGNDVYLLPGDGNGRFGAAERKELPGPITALVTGEINRADGLADFVVAVNGPQGARVLVFESPLGAWKAQPEVFALSGEATDLALGRFRGKYTVDLAAAVGSQVVFIEGRDRKLLWDDAHKLAVPPATISRFSFPLPITSLAAGHFDLDGRESLAVLLADGSIYRVDPDALQVAGVAPSAAQWESSVIDAGSRTSASRMVAGRISARGGDNLILLDRSNHQVRVQSSADATARVSHALVNEPVAVLAVRTGDRATSQLVVLQAGFSAPTVVAASSATTFTVTNTNDSGAGSLRQAILDANANFTGTSTVTFNIPGSGPFTITPRTPLPNLFNPGTTIDATTQPGFSPNGDPVVFLDGSSAGASDGIGIAAANCTVKGLAIGNFQGDGIIVFFQSTGTVLSFNYVGVSPSFSDAPNGTGINVFASSVTITQNNISGNKLDGVDLNNGVTGASISGNFIGVKPNDVVSPNGLTGINLLGSSNNSIGGSTPGAGNVISGNSLSGVHLGVSPSNNPSDGNMIEGNLIGTDSTGMSALPNTTGVLLQNSANNTLGGTAGGTANTISGNNSDAVFLDGPSATNNNFIGNFIGTSQVPSMSMPFVPANVNCAPFANCGDGVHVDLGAANNLIGGSASGVGNTIGGSKGDGVTLSGGATGNVIQNNFIGTDSSGTTNLGDGGNGVGTSTVTKDFVLGNVIANNNKAGIMVDSASDQVTIQLNTYSNNIGGLIVLQGQVPWVCPGPSPGANGSQPAPILTAVTVGPGNTTVVDGTVMGPPNSVLLLVFQTGSSPSDPAKLGLGTLTVVTDASCTATFHASFPVAINTSEFVTVNATDPFGNSSQFATPVQVSGTTCSSITITPGTLPDHAAGALYPTQTFMATGGSGTITLSESGALPPGMTFVNAVLSGTPTKTGTFMITVTATDANGCTGSQSYNFRIICPTFNVTINGLPAGSPVPATVGAPYPSATNSPQLFHPVGGVGPYTFTPSGLPPGMSFNPLPGDQFALVGQPTQAGTYSFTVTVTDANGCTGTVGFSIVVNPAGTTTSVNCQSPVVVGQTDMCTVMEMPVPPSTSPVNGTTVQLVVDGNPGSTCTIMSGMCTIAESFSSAGLHMVSAMSQPNSNYNGATAPPMPVSVNKASVMVTETCQSPVVVGQPDICTVTVMPVAPSTAPVNGPIVQDTVDGKPGHSCTILSGRCTTSETFTTTGTHMISADSMSNANYNAAISPAVSVLVTAAPTVNLVTTVASATHDTTNHEYVFVFKVANYGTGAANNVEVTAATITFGTNSPVNTTTPLPVPLGSIPAGGSATCILEYEDSAGPSGARAVLRLKPSYVTPLGKSAHASATILITAP